MFHRNPHTVLLVEDEPLTALNQRTALSEAGLEVRHAENGTCAVEMARDPEVDLVLMDIDLGSGIDGTEAARRILADRDLPIVFLTSHTEQSYLERVRELTRYGYVLKSSGTFVLLESISMAYELHSVLTKYRILFDTITDGIILVDQETASILECNAAAEALFGAEPGGLNGMYVPHLSSDPEATLRGIRGEADLEPHIVPRRTLRRRDGSEFTAHLSVRYFEMAGRRLNVTTVRDVTEASRMVDRLEASEEQFRQLFEATAEGVFLLEALDDGARFRVVDVNPAALESDGLARDSVVGRIVTEVYPRLEEHGLIHVFREVYRSGRRREHPVMVYDGPRLQEWILNTVVRLPSGMVVCILSDQTEVRQAQEAAELRSKLLDAVGQTVFVTDLQGIVRYWNRAAEDAFGWSATEALGRMGQDLSGARVSTETEQAIQEAIQRGDTWTGEITVTHRDGRRFPFLLTTAATYDHTGAVAGIVGVGLDVSEQHRSEELLRHQRQQLVEAQRMAHLGHYHWSLQAGRWSHSQELDVIFGIDADYPYNDLEGWLNIVAPEDRDAMAAYMQDEVLGRGRSFDREYRVVDQRTGRRKWVHGLGSLMRGETGDLVAMFGTIQDITTRRNAEDAERIKTRALTLINQVNRMVVTSQTEEMLFNRTCRLAVDTGGYRLAWIGRAEHDGSFVITPVAFAGETPEYLTGLTLRWDESPEGKGPAGTAVRTGAFQVTRSAQEDEAFAPWQAAARAHGLRSVAAFPVVINGRPWGVLTLYGESSDDFTDGEVSLLRELAETVGIGATMLRERRDRQKAESGLRQALRDKDNLMRELNHRVKNNLNLVSSLISLKDRQMHETVDLTDLRNWVDSIRSVHEQLMHSPDATTVVLDRYLSDVVRPLFHGDLFAGIVPELDLRVPRMVISSRNAVSLGLIVNELATNAVKYATEPGAGLHFSVELSGEASGPFRLEVANNGAPLPEAIDLADGQSLGLGLTLIVSLVQSLGGSISVDRAAGTRYVMEFPSLS